MGLAGFYFRFLYLLRGIEMGPGLELIFGFQIELPSDLSNSKP